LRLKTIFESSGVSNGGQQVIPFPMEISNREESGRNALLQRGDVVMVP
jgi:hypothetical protein